MGSCCSMGHCTDDLVCKDGNKIVGDYCDKNSECMTGYCELNSGSQKHTCNTVPQSDFKKIFNDVFPYISMILLLLFAGIFLIKEYSKRRI